MKFKKGQIAGQVFIFILAAFLAVLIIGYGYRAISSFTSRTEDIALADFKTTLQGKVRTIASSHDVRKLELRVPGKYEEVCFVDLGKRELAAGSCLCDLDCRDYSPEVCDAWMTEGYEYNVFLIPITPIKAAEMEIDGGYFCIEPEGGRISLRLEGKGNRTNVSEWE